VKTLLNLLFLSFFSFFLPLVLGSAIPPQLKDYQKKQTDTGSKSVVSSEAVSVTTRTSTPLTGGVGGSSQEAAFPSTLLKTDTPMVTEGGAKWALPPVRTTTGVSQV